MCRSVKTKRKAFCAALTIPLIFLAVLVFSIVSADADQPKRILILNSYHPGFSFSDLEVEGIRSMLPQRTEVHFEYMDAKRISSDPKVFALLYQLYLKKYSQFRFDVIASLDDDAFQFLLMNRDDLFGATPVVFMGVNNYQKNMLAKQSLYTGVVETIDINESIALSLRLHPNAKKVHVITDNTTTGRINRRYIEELSEKKVFPVSFEFLDQGNGLTLDELIAKVRAVSQENVIYYSDFFQDKTGKVLKPEDVMQAVSVASPVPIYVHGALYLGSGAMGGKVNSGYYHGRQGGSLVRRILDGQDINIIPVELRSETQYMFDAKQLERFHIKFANLPEGSIVINQTIPFWVQYRTTVFLACGIIVSLVLIIAVLSFNIVRRKEAERYLLQSERRLSDIVDFLPDATFAIDRNGTITAWNRAMERMTGRKKELMLGCANHEYSIPFYGIRRPILIDLTFQSKEEIKEEYDFIETKEGAIVAEAFAPLLNEGRGAHLWGVATVLRDEGGTIVGAIESIRDITDKKIAEKLLRLNAARVQALLKLNQMSSSALQEITDFALEESVRLTQSTIGYLAFLNEDESILTMHSWSRLAMQECALVNKPIEFPVKDTGLWGEAVRQRRAIIINDYAAPNPCKKGYPAGHVEVHRHMNVPIFSGQRIVIVAGVGNKSDAYNDNDVLQLRLLMEGMWQVIERKKTREALEQSREQYRRIVDTANEGIWAIDENGRTGFVNAQMAALLGYTPEEMIGQSPEFFIFEEDLPDHRLRMQKRQTGAAEHYERRWRRKDGQAVWTIVSATPNFDSDHRFRGSFAMVLDITERKRLEEQLRQSQKMEAIGTLAGGIAHDFNNLLTSILGNTTMILHEIPQDHPFYRRLKSMESHIMSAGELTKQLLGFARGGKYEVKPANLNDIVTSTAEMFGRAKKEITITSRLQPDLHPVEVDRVQIEQVLLNLYVNAWQAMPQGGSVFLVTENVVLDDQYCRYHGVVQGAYAKLSVTDTGAGMDETTLKRIFEPFFTTKTKGIGTGLGLASAYGIIKNHGGIITAYSEIGHGSTFMIYLPASLKEVVMEAPVSKGLVAGVGTILLVDDQDIVSDIGADMLSLLGYDVLVAKSGEEAISIYNEKNDCILLVILDMIMPVMSGSETFERLKRIRPDVKVILSSGYSINGQASEILNRGCRGFIQKPFNLQELSNKIQQVLRQ